VEDAPNTLFGQVIALNDQGYNSAQIVKELRSRHPEVHVTVDRVRGIIRRSTSRSLDSRRLAEIHEMLIELLAVMREHVKIDRDRLAAKMKTIERRDLPRKLGAALTKSS
jgi:septum formation topological specificity factor MinE